MFDVFPFDVLLNEERRLSSNWGYALSKVVASLVEKREQKEKQARLVAAKKQEQTKADDKTEKAS